jgi:type IV pilus assembly protein PilC
MPETFAYKVLDKSGHMTEGTIEAENPTLVASKLKQMGLTPIAIDKQSTSAMKKELSIPGFGPKAKLKDLAVFSRQFATMINAGLTLLRTLTILGEQTENSVLRKAVQAVRIDVEKGASLSQALAKHPKVFNRLYVAMIRAGESAGVLDQVLVQLANIIEKQVELRGRIKSAMTYPITVMCLVSLILAAMMLFVVPMFKHLYSSLGGTLPVPTRILIFVSNAAVKFSPFIIIAIAIFVWWFRRWKKTPAGKAIWDRLLLRVPIFGKLVHKTCLVRFSQTLAVLIRSGVPILESLDITSETTGNTVLGEAIRDVQTGVRKGETLARPLQAHSVIPAMVVQMMAVGEETGALDVMLEKIAMFYEQEVQATVDALTSLLEPLLIVVLGGTIGAMVIALYMPMFNIIKLIK